MSVTGNQLFARARTIATQMGMDANQAPTIDSLGGIRSLLNNVIRDVYRKKAVDQRFRKDIVENHTIAMTSGSGACPENIMREFLSEANYRDSLTPSSLITYYNYAMDEYSGETYKQLGYLYLDGSTFKYIARSPVLSTFSGSLFIEVPTFPTLPGSMASVIPFPSTTTADDIQIALAYAIMGKEVPVET